MYTQCTYIGINNIICVCNIILILIYIANSFPILFVPGGPKNRNRHTTCTVQLLYQCCSQRYMYYYLPYRWPSTQSPDTRLSIHNHYNTHTHTHTYTFQENKIILLFIFSPPPSIWRQAIGHRSCDPADRCILRKYWPV